MAFRFLSLFLLAWPGILAACYLSGHAFHMQNALPAGEVRFLQMNDSIHVEVIGLKPEVLQKLKELKLGLKDWQRLFPVFLGETYPRDPRQTLPILGTYQITNDAISFVPRFPFRRGLTHYTRFDLKGLHALIDLEEADQQDFWETIFFLEKPDSPAETTIINIFPSTDTVPANLLKVYIHFSAAMGYGNVHKYIHLLNSRDEEIKLPFVEVEQGLWDRSRKRLTLFFHPGRIKRGVAPNLQMGPPLKEGETYRLIIDRNWKDAFGNPLVENFQKKFKVTSADREEVNCEEWRIVSPRVKTREPLTVKFPEPLDHALLARMLIVTDARDNLISGEIGITNGEMRWHFVPDAPWQAGNYSIKINTALEDLAGNNLTGVFDREMGIFEQELTGARFVELKFIIAQNQDATF